MQYSDSFSRENLIAGFHTAAFLVVNALDAVVEASEKEEVVSGLPTGILSLDELTQGLHPGELVILAGRPTTGKSALALTIVNHVAGTQRVPVAFYCLEQSLKGLADRLICCAGRIDLGRMRNGKLKDDEWVRLTEAIEKLRNVPLYAYAQPSLTIDRLRQSAMELVKETGKLGLIIVDYLQLMLGGVGPETRAAAMGEITRGLKALAIELSCPVLALSQVARTTEGRPNKRPTLHELYESGSLEHDADVVLSLFREGAYWKARDQSECQFVELTVAKNRSGSQGALQLFFWLNWLRMDNVAEGDS